MSGSIVFAAFSFGELIGRLRWCLTTTIFSATQRCIIVATLFRMAATLFQYCNAVLRQTSSLRIVPCNITFKQLRRRRRRRQRQLQKNNWFNDQNNSSARASRFLVHFFDVNDYEVKPLNLTFYGGRGHTTTSFPSSF